MGKKSIDRKAATLFIKESRVAGKTDQEIYTVLSEQYFDKKAIALLITSIVTPQNKQKYKVLNTILLVLIGITVLFKILTVFSLVMATSQIWALLFVFLLPLINIYFFYEVARYNGTVYRILGILTIASFLQGVSKEEGPDIIINLVLCAAICGLAFYLAGNMFPNYSPKNLKKDSKGEYVLD